jgi:plasmid stabilization system protein ParE
MTVYHLLRAEHEILEAVKFYDSRADGLAADFFAQFKKARRDIIDFPELWGEIGGAYRRKLVDRYPYGIIYRIESEQIIVVALVHTSRKPGYWIKDLDK